MKRKIKILALAAVITSGMLGAAYYYFCVYGSYVTIYSLFDIEAEVKGNIVTITAETASSGNAYAGFDASWNGNDLQIKPRYSLASRYNPSGRMEIIYDTNGHPMDKVILAGGSEDDRIQLWPVDRAEQGIDLDGVKQYSQNR